MKLALALFVAGCFSEPSRPHGDGPPIVAGSVVRHKMVVGDLNNDGYDDLVLFGNDGAPSVNPTLFVFFGGESLENPDLRISVAIDNKDVVFTSFEVLDASISISADGKTRGIVALVAERDGGTAEGNYPVFVPFDGRTAGDLIVGDPTGLAISSSAPENFGYFALFRDTQAALPAHEMLFGSNAVMFHTGAPLSPDVSDQLVAFNITDLARSIFVLPPTGAFEDLLFIGEQSAARTVGDLDPSLGSDQFAGKYAMSKPVDIGDDNDREGRGRLAKDGHFYAITTRSGPFDLPVLDVPPTGDMVMYHLTPTSQVDDVAIADLGGASALDVVALQSGTLGVYEDLELANDAATPAHTIGDRDPLVGYDMLAVGNFHGDGQLEIYAASDVQPELRLECFHLDAALDPCDPE
jgi:hypothetical protein